jgi:hypothetical protein
MQTLTGHRSRPKTPSEILSDGPECRHASIVERTVGRFGTRQHRASAAGQVLLCCPVPGAEARQRIGGEPALVLDLRSRVYAGQSNLKRVTVETGGKSPQITTAAAPDLDRAGDYAISGIYANKGEMCSACSSKPLSTTLSSSASGQRPPPPSASATRSTRRRRWGRWSTARSSSASSPISNAAARLAVWRGVVKDA